SSDVCSSNLYAAERGASAVVVAPPYYFPAGQPELLEYACSVADETPLPVVFYNMPACTKIGFELDTLHTLLDHRNVAAFKDSSGNMLYFHRALQLVAKHPDKSILIGPEELLAEATLLGGHGGISGGANVFPHLYVQLHHAAARGDLAATRRFHDQVMKVSSSLYTIGRFSSSTIKGIKGALACLGICD